MSNESSSVEEKESSEENQIEVEEVVDEVVEVEEKFDEEGLDPGELAMAKDLGFIKDKVRGLELEVESEIYSADEKLSYFEIGIEKELIYTRYANKLLKLLKECK